ncbi:MAG: GatB/YqeY domain-containing protein [bacterium]
MDTRERMDKDFTGAVKARDAFAVSGLRMLRAALKNAEIEKMSPLVEEDVIDVISKEMKKVKDSLESFESAGREDLAEQSRREIELFSRYLPEQLTDDELKSIVKKVIAEGSAGNFGQVMSAVMVEVKGRASGGQVSKMVKEELSSTAP